MKIEYSDLSLEELLQMQKDVEQAIADFEKKKKKEALEEIKAVAEKHGFEVADLVEGGKKSKRSKIEPKYRNPKNSAETWTGRGRKPKWLMEAIETGEELESFLIAS